MVRGLDSSTAEELVQDVLLTVFRRSREMRNKLCFTGWLYQVARNAFLQEVRKRRIPVESITSKSGADRNIRQAQENFRIPMESEMFDWIQVLAEDEREICLMRYMDGLEYQSISEALQIPMGTVKWKLHQIKKKIAVQLRISQEYQRL